MNRQGYIQYNLMLSPENSGRADSYARAIRILEDVLPFQNVVDLRGQSLYTISDIETIEKLEAVVKTEVAKMKRNEPNIFDHGNPKQRSYPLKNFCSSALRSFKNYVLYEHDIKEADAIVAQEQDPQRIAKRLVSHFGLTKDGTDEISQVKRRKGQNYFRRMVLSNYNSRCALSGIDIQQLLLASHIIPWAEDKKERLNPCNGICLSALYDKAFDQGLIGFNSQYKTVLSNRIVENEGKDYYEKYFAPIAGKELAMPTTFKPEPKFLEWHMDEVFLR